MASIVNRARLDLELAKIVTENQSSGFYAVRSEDLTSSTFQTVSSIVSLNLSFHNCLLHPTLLGKTYTGNNLSNQKFIGVSRANVGRWKDRITKHEACIIEAWFGSVMKYWNYFHVYNTEDHLESLADFYAWYNSRYFYSDSFQLK